MIEKAGECTLFVLMLCKPPRSSDDDGIKLTPVPYSLKHSKAYAFAVPRHCSQVLKTCIGCCRRRLQYTVHFVLMQGAGGSITDWSGQELTWQPSPGDTDLVSSWPNEVLATGDARMQKAALKLLQGWDSSCSQGSQFSRDACACVTLFPPGSSSTQLQIACGSMLPPPFPSYWLLTWVSHWVQPFWMAYTRFSQSVILCWTSWLGRILRYHLTVTLMGRCLVRQRVHWRSASCLRCRADWAESIQLNLHLFSLESFIACSSSLHCCMGMKWLRTDNYHHYRICYHIISMIPSCNLFVPWQGI